jgi:hypothetical protein
MLTRRHIWRRTFTKNNLDKEKERLNKDITIPKKCKMDTSNLVKESRKKIKKKVNFDSFKEIIIFEPYATIH